MIDVAFALTDHDGYAVTPATYRGRWMLVFFGFTHCKVVCPRNLAKLSVVLEKLGKQAEKIVPLYVSVDPERDTPERMKSWLCEHYPCFTGLTGDKTAADEARAAFRVFAQRRELPDGEEGYDMPHTALTYLVDPEGQYRTHFGETLDANAIAERIIEQFHTESSDA
jgi:protein SCO1